MGDKLEKAVDAIIKKTGNGVINWERIDIKEYRSNPFYRKYVDDNYFELDGMNSYMAPYNGGYIFFTNQVNSGYREVAIQPKINADITVLSSGNDSKLKLLESTIKNELDSPDDFIDSLFD